MIYRYRLHYRCVCVCVCGCAPAPARTLSFAQSDQVSDQQPWPVFTKRSSTWKPNFNGFFFTVS